MSDLIIMLVTAICFAVLSVGFVSGLPRVFTRNRQKRITYLRSFKKGRFAVIYATAFPLCFIGRFFVEKKLFESFFGAIADVFEIVVLKYDFESISALLNADDFYKATFYICYIMVGLNIVLFAVSLANHRVWEFFRKVKIRYCPKDRLFIFGSNLQNVDIYNSDKERCKVIVDKISDNGRSEYYLNNISYLSEISDEEAVDEIFANRGITSLLCKIYKVIKRKKSDRSNIVVINTGSDERNMFICRKIIGKIKASNDEEKLFRTLKVFVFGETGYEAVYEDIEADGCGCITYINKYKNIGIDFIERYPLAYFMDERQIDYKTSLVRKDININFFMVCFGKVSRQIFLTSVANNQFVTEGENGPELKKVKYHIFDKEVAQNNKNLNHNYYRFRDEVKDCKQEEYLPLPSLPADEIYYHLDVNDGKFYSVLKECTCGNKNDINFVLVSFGDDLENIDMAQRLIAKCREWDIKNLVIFVRACARTEEQKALEKDGCLFIGNEKETVYNIDRIMSDKIRDIAIMRNEVYDLEYAVNGKKPEEITDEFTQKKRFESFKNWHTDMHRIMRESNIYAALSIRTKLNLMGLDYCEADANDEPALTEKEYFAVYAQNDMPRYSGKTALGGRKIIEYDLDFADSRRRNMAILEHYRWNSYLISKGFVPATVEQIKNEKAENGKYTNGKSYLLRRHGNLTTFDGLIKFRKIVAERDGVSEKEKDVIKYDYQILDDLYYFLTEDGYKIIKKK